MKTLFEKIMEKVSSGDFKNYKAFEKRYEDQPITINQMYWMFTGIRALFKHLK